MPKLEQSQNLARMRIFNFAMIKPEWGRGQSRVSEQEHGLGRPLLQALLAARNLPPPQSPMIGFKDNNWDMGLGG